MEIGFGKVSISTGMSSINQAIVSLGGPFAVALSGRRNFPQPVDQNAVWLLGAQQFGGLIGRA
jgi:hypothetical protein